MYRTVVVTVLSLSLLHCSGLSPAGKAVRVTTEPAVVRECTFIGQTQATAGWLGGMSASADTQVEHTLQNQAAAMGGNVLHLVSLRLRPVAQGVADVYRCALDPAAS